MIVQQQAVQMSISEQWVRVLVKIQEQQLGIVDINKFQEALYYVYLLTFWPWWLHRQTCLRFREPACACRKTNAWDISCLCSFRSSPPCDLTPLYFFLRISLKSKVYANKSTFKVNVENFDERVRLSQQSRESHLPSV